MKILATCFTDVGNVREVNQDGILIKIGKLEGKDCALVAIADGMGGLTAGEVASGIALSYLEEWWQLHLSRIILEQESIESLSDDLDMLLSSINLEIIDFSAKLGSNSGTTLSLMLIYQNQYLIKHVGDSRIYCIQNKHLVQRTRDDSYVQLQVDLGELSPDEARNHPQQNILTNCLGREQFDFSQTLLGNIEKKMEFVLCSDGTYNYISEKDLVHYLKKINVKLSNDQQYLKKIIEAIKKNGAPDNLSMIYVRTHND